ncbi:hypothetical protein [Azonexus sp.]|uniref:hypothetical protein n=1 Tax=Azonexus sp. TaxID=1872668 RepID=UPI0028195CC9|nr:hypothetical protein [Azonexus sp.]MDR1994732.1 hypothetical protein [Azonexus sp.]
MDSGDEAQQPDTPPSAPPEQTSEAAAPARSTAVWFGLIALVLVIVAGGLWLFKQSTNEVTEVPPAPAPSAPAAEPPEEVPLAPAATETPPAVADQPATDKPVILNEAEAKDLIARLQTGPQPASCRTGTAKIRKDNNLTANQAGAIAKRAWPDLCSSPKPAVAAPTPQPEATMPALPASESKSIDQLYKERSTNECAAGVSGFFCREGLRNKLCAGKWSSTPPAGQALCYLPDANR